MIIYRAETGQRVKWHSTDSDKIETLDDFTQALERMTGIPAESQILMTSFGNQVRQDQVKDVISATGSDEYIIFLYDRQYLPASESQLETLLDMETPRLEPRVPVFDASTALATIKRARDIQKLSLYQICEHYLKLFSAFEEYSKNILAAISAHAKLSQIIVDELKAQSQALNVALANLESHKDRVHSEILSCCAETEEDLSDQFALVDTASMDLTVLRSVQIHSSIADKIKSSPKRMLVDFVNEEEIESATRDTRNLCQCLDREIRELRILGQDLVRNDQELQRKIAEDHDLQSLDTAVTDILEIMYKAEFLRDKIKRDLERVQSKISELLQIPISSMDPDTLRQLEQREQHRGAASSSPTAISSHARKTLEAFSHLAEIHVDDYIPKLTGYETGVREKTAQLVVSKQHGIEKFLGNMNVISQLQSDISTLYIRIKDVNKERQEYKERHGDTFDLKYAHGIIFAYGYLLIELARRNEHASIMKESAKSLADLFASFRIEEQARREQFMQNELKQLPFQLANIHAEVPYCDVSFGELDEELFPVGKNDVVQYVKIISECYAAAKSPKVATSPMYDHGNNKRLSVFRSYQQSMFSSRSGHLNTRPPFRKASVDDGNGMFMDLLERMNTELDALREDFKRAMRTTLSTVLPVYRDSRTLSHDTEAHRQELELQQKTKALELAETQIKSYETRIASLERLLQQKYRTGSDAAAESLVRRRGENTSQSASSTSSAYSVVDSQTEQRLNDGSPRRIEDLLRQKDQQIMELHIALRNQENKWENYRVQNEAEKEELRLQQQELEQLLEEERMTYEDNRKSLLKEAQIKDNLADMRIASVEDDWRAKLNELESRLEKERERNDKLRDHYQLELEKQKQEYELKLEEQRQENARLKKQSENELQKLRNEMDDTEEARNVIKQELAQARNMVKRAEESWTQKQQMLEQAASQLAGLLSQYQSTPKFDPVNKDILVIVDAIERCLNAVNCRAEMAEQELGRTQNEYSQLTRKLKTVSEQRMDMRALGIQMADKLDDFRKNILYEITHQLQLSVDEDEAGAMTKKFTVSPDQDERAFWMQIIQAAETIDAQKFVSRVRKKVKDAHELTKRWQREYKELKEKYNKVASSAHDKIAFRNFKVGDVALFLPTRNSSGKPWAAFNISAPHYFLKPSESVAFQMNTREWIVARITSITEHVVNAQDPSTNPYGLADGLTFYHLEVEHWKASHRRKEKSRSKPHGSSKSKAPAENVEGPSSTPNPQPSSSRYPLSPTQDIGLASIRPRNSDSPSNNPGSSSVASMSTSSIVHSYSPPSSQGRRHSVGYFSIDRQGSIDSTNIWTAQE
ncbi:hypothetical protein VTP01DRAFT_10918 [Rhizomucor pusillus]|uniref:uncharacterized protein n=1 Tax=Rhizomucor pusillus TaxID=4840 RepID=UPI0037428530